MKRWFGRGLAFLLAAVMALGCAAAEEAKAPEEHTVEKRTYPHIWHYDQFETESVYEGEMNLYFVDGGDIPYVALSEYIPLLAKVACEAKYYGVEKIDFEIAPEPEPGFFMVTRPDNGSALIIDTAQDTMTFTSYNSFLQRPGSSRLVSLMEIPDPDENEDPAVKMQQILEAMQSGTASAEELMALVGGAAEVPEEDHSFFVGSYKVFNRRGRPLTLQLADYHIDLVSAGGECYLPFQTMNDFLMCPMYIQYVFTGNMVIGDTNSGELMNRMYETEPADMSTEFAMFNFRELCLFLDNCYGLKEEHRIGTFLDYLAMDARMLPRMTGTDAEGFDSALTELLMLYFDDSHSGLQKASWRNRSVIPGVDKIKTLTNIGFSTRMRVQGATGLASARMEAFPDGVPPYQEIGDTAFITFDHFTASRKAEDYYNLEDPDNPKDTIELICYAHRQVTREGSPVKNIVLDLSANSGGNSDAALAVACWFTGETTITLRDTMTGAETIAAYRADINLNGFIKTDTDGKGKCDPDDTVSGRYNLFCLTSSQSFSCANLVPAIFEQHGGITLIGRRTGGGSNAVLPASSASGTCFQFSGPLQVSTICNGSFYNVDTGIAPHVVLTQDRSFYDREGLVELIHQLKKNKKESCFSQPSGGTFPVNQHLPRPVAGSSCFLGSAKILLRTSSRSAKKFPPLTCAISFTFSSLVFIFLSSCLFGVILYFLSGCFTPDTYIYVTPDRLSANSQLFLKQKGTVPFRLIFIRSGPGQDDKLDPGAPERDEPGNTPAIGKRRKKE